MPRPRPKQHLLCLRPQALHKLPKLGRCAALCQRCNNASREETRNTAIPLATIGIPFMPPLSTTTCLKKPSMPQMPQEAEMLHPNQRSLGVPGAPKTAAPTSIQLPTARCCNTPTPMTNGRSSTNTRCATVALSKAITGSTAPTKFRNAALYAATPIIQTYNVCPSNKPQLTQALADNLALNVSLAFRDTRYSQTRLAARAPLYSAILNLVSPSKD